MERRQPSRGFTLIELLVVIAIIAILAALLFPTLVRARKYALLGHCASNVHQIIAALRMYASDNYGYLMPGGWYAPWGTGYGWTERILKYTVNPKVYMCPETRFVFSYGLNANLVMPIPGNGISGSELWGNFNYVKSPGKCILIYEYNPAVRKAYMFDMKQADPDLTNDTQPDGLVYVKQGVWEYWMRFPGPHNGSQPVGFVDGHIKVYRDWDGKSMTFSPGKS